MTVTPPESVYSSSPVNLTKQSKQQLLPLTSRTTNLPPMSVISRTTFQQSPNPTSSESTTSKHSSNMSNAPSPFDSSKSYSQILNLPQSNAQPQLPNVPGYELAILHQETFIPCPHAQDAASQTANATKRKKSVLSRNSLRGELQSELASSKCLPDDNPTVRLSESSASAENAPSTSSRTGPAELMGSQVESVLNFLNKQLLLKPQMYLHALFSYAFDGIAESVEERRSITWIAQPLILNNDISHLLDLQPDWSDPETVPPSVWEIDFENCLPKTFDSTFEVSLQVPNTTFYRTCFCTSIDFCSTKN